MVSQLPSSYSTRMRATLGWFVTMLGGCLWDSDSILSENLAHVLYRLASVSRHAL